MSQFDQENLSTLKKRIDEIKQKENSNNKLKKNFIFIFGVLLPFITLVIELTTKFCSEALLNPIPTYKHVFLISLVPLFNLAFLTKFSDKKDIDNNKLVFYFSGIVLIISFYYSLFFIPFSLIALFAIIFLGLGFLPLSPILSFISSALSIFMMLKKSKKSLSSNILKIFVGAILGISTILMVEMRGLITNYGVSLLEKNDHERNIEGLQILREYGDIEKVKKLHYSYYPDTSDIIMTYLGYPKPYYLDMSKIYYLLTGEQLKNRYFNNEGRFRVVGSNKVGFKQSQLYLSNSNIDVISKPEKGYFYTEWTLNFKNDALYNQEARALIKLPKNSVVSKASLWINGEEKQAVFAGKNEVTQAYQKIVSKSRDPLLVNYAGEDKVLIQCFPVLSKGEMKIRLGITTSLQDKEIYLPRFIASNFENIENLTHNVMIESKSDLENSTLFTISKNNNIYNVSGALKEEQIQSNIKLIHKKEILDKNLFLDINEKNQVIKSSLKLNKNTTKNLILAIDTSYESIKNFENLSNSIKNIPNNINLYALLASDNVIKISGGKEKIAESLKSYNLKGGFDNTPMLVEAYDYYNKLPKSERDFTKILWIHSAQPDFFTLDSFNFEQKRRKFDKPVIYEIQIGEGLDSILYDASSYIDFKTLDEDSLDKNISKLIYPYFELKLENIKGNNYKNLEQDIHISKLWAYKSVENLLKENKYKEALNIAMNYKIITPISGAVVLESKKQYEENGLGEAHNKQSSSNNNVPIIPEPHEWILIIISILFISFYFYKNKKELFIKA